MSQESVGTVADDIGGRGASAEIAEAQPLATIPLSAVHRVADFTCSKSERVTRFLRVQAGDWAARRYCSVFVLTDPDDPTRVWGYYTLSQFAVSRDEMRNKHRSSHKLQAVPLAQIGYMGKQDGAPPRLGAVLLTDAARRVQRCTDIPAWGITLEPEGGRENAKLWTWYESAKFFPLRKEGTRVYATLEDLIP